MWILGFYEFPSKEDILGHSNESVVASGVSVIAVCEESSADTYISSRHGDRPLCDEPEHGVAGPGITSTARDLPCAR